MSQRSHAQPPASLETVLRTAVGVLLLPALLIYASAAVYIGTLFKASSTRLHYSYVWFARACLRVSATSLEVRGLEHLEAVAELRSLARQRVRALGYDPRGVD